MVLYTGWEVYGPEVGEGIRGGVVLLAEGEWTVEKNLVMVGWDGLMMGR